MAKKTESEQTGFCMTCNFSHYLFFKRGEINVLCFEQTSDCNAYDNKLATFKDWFDLATLTRLKSDGAVTLGQTPKIC